MSAFQTLIPCQQHAVDHNEGPLLVLAGPGSGKTRVITHRIVRLIERGVRASNILALTFTNKAATEMATRVSKLLPGARVWVSTFHSFCARLLREKAEFVGLQSNFSIYDTLDQDRVIRRILDDMGFDRSHYPPSRVAARISRAKNDRQTAERFCQAHENSIGDHFQSIVAKIYPAYQTALLESNAVDFDDLLLHVVSLISENPLFCRQLADRHRYIMVDEYQDTNMAQYQIVASIAQLHQNLCVTGDPDQSIYGWRGAQIKNILRFESDFPAARVVRLEHNFRSTKSILQAADSLIAHNRFRKQKTLLTENSQGIEVELLSACDAAHEARLIAQGIHEQVESSNRQWSDFAVFYRVNSLSREIESAFRLRGVPYRVAASVAYFERAEIKDLLGYLRLIHNANDREAFLRIVNKPLRGLGKTSLKTLIAWAENGGVRLLEAASRADEISSLRKRATTAFKEFSRMISDIASTEWDSIHVLLQAILDQTNFTLAWQTSDTEQDIQRLSNVNELLTVARQYDEASGEGASLQGFLEATSLVQDTDGVDESAGQVTLMTLHAAKGLEFPIVYIVGVEQNLIPHERSLRENDVRQLEEERRLLFVGMTRAMQELYLTKTVKRNVWGQQMHSIPSQFLSEMTLKSRDCSDSSFEHPEESTLVIEHPESLFVRSRPEKSPSGKKRGPILTTAAALLNGDKAAREVPQGFAVGMTVRHPQYGLGTVRTVSGFSKRRRLTVEFHDTTAIKTFVAAKCPLQPVGLH